MLVQDLLQRSAKLLPEKTALVCGSERFSYSQLDCMSNRLAHALREDGIRRGDRVGIYLSNTPAAVVAIFGALKAGAAFVAINRATKPEKAAFILNNCQAGACVIDSRAASQGLAEKLLADVPSLHGIWVADDKGLRAVNGAPRIHDFAVAVGSGPITPPACDCIDLDLACLIYTSGTTGEPKGVMCDHSNVVFVTEAIVHYLENASSDVVLSVLSLAFSYGLYQLLASVCVGGTLVLEESFAFPAVIVQKMVEHRVSGFAGVPTIYSMLLGMDLTRHDLSRLRYLTNAAAGLPVEHVKRVRQALPWVKLFLMHGLTEVARTMYLPPDQTDSRPASSGIAMPGTELWIENEEGRRLGPGEVGELVVRGRHVMRGYWGDPELTALRFRPAPLAGERICYSGDLFRTDEEGYFYFVSRMDDIIKCRGEKIAPREVENVIYTIPGVQDAAVVGMPDAVLGQSVTAFIVAPEANLTEPEVIAYCKARLEEVMVPRRVEFRSELPKTASGKIKRMDLR